MKPLFSLVVSTLGNTSLVAALFESFTRSEYRNFEVIVVDQNPPGTLDEIIARYASRLEIHHHNVFWQGLSKARNYGVQQARGEIVYFPDDDAEIFPDTLSRALETMNITHSDVVSGRSINRIGKSTMVAFPDHSARLTLARHEGLFIEYVMFIKRETALRFPFDETFGPGRFFGAEEGHDLVLRMLKAGVVMFYSPCVRVYHPDKVMDHASPASIRRVFAYRCGLSRMCLRHKLYGKLATRFIKVCLYLPYVFFTQPRKVRYYLAELLALLTGLVVK